MRIETERLNIRLTEERDCAFITRYFQEESVIAPLERPPMPFRYIDALSFFKRMEKTYDTNRPELFTLADKRTDVLMGCIGLHPENTFDQRKDVAELGYWLGKPFWRQGLMFEATKRVVQKAFMDMGWVELVAQTNTDNKPSQGLLKKLGFVFLGERTRPTPPTRGTPTDLCWSLTLETYLKSRS